MTDTDAERAAVVAEARAWLRTPYHHMGRVKGAGVDCATLLAEVYARAGVVPALDIPFYPPDWHLHRNAERYLDFILAHAVEIGEAKGAAESRPSPSCEAKPTSEAKGAAESRPSPSCEANPKPGDVALWRFGKCFSHGAIVVAWPLVIHAYAGKGCVLEDVEKALWLSRLAGKRASEDRPVRFFMLKRWAEAERAQHHRIKVTLGPALAAGQRG